MTDLPNPDTPSNTADANTADANTAVNATDNAGSNTTANTPAPATSPAQVTETGGTTPASSLLSDTPISPAVSDAGPASPVSLDHLGGLSERQLLRALEAIRVSGTLLLERAEEVSLTVLAEGRTVVSFEIPHDTADEGVQPSVSHALASTRRFTLYSYTEDSHGLPLPKLASSYPTSHLPVLQALPNLAARARVVSSSLSPELLVQEHVAGWGIVIFERQENQRGERGYVLVAAGNLQAAAVERKRSPNQDTPDVLMGDDALKFLLGLEGTMTFSYIPLPSFMIASLRTLHGQPQVENTTDSQAHQASSKAESLSETAPENTKGPAKPAEDSASDAVTSSAEDPVENPVEDTTEDAAEDATEDASLEAAATQTLAAAMQVDAAGYTFYHEGTACLHVNVLARAAFGHYQQADTPAIALPDATANLVKKYYALTLRGRDALSPMMDLFRDVQKEFGISGKQVLHALAKPQSSHDLLAVEPDPDSLQELLRRLERGGLIFEIDPDQHDVG